MSRLKELAGWHAFFRRAGWLESVGIVGVLVVTLVALLAPWIAPFAPNVRVAESFLPPSAGHWFGTDEIGRDFLSRIVLGVQYTWLPAVGIVFVSLVGGVVLLVLAMRAANRP